MNARRLASQQVGGQQVSYYTQVTCQATCQQAQITLCDPLAPKCPGTAPNCKPSQLLPAGFFGCQTASQVIKKLFSLERPHRYLQATLTA